MSSHHFVKENQEPAILIWDIEKINFEKIASLLEWVPLVMVHENAVERVISWGIKIDKIYSSQAFFLKFQHLLEDQYPLEFVLAEEVQSLTQALQFLKQFGQMAVNIIGADPHQIVIEATSKKIDVVLFDQDWRYVLVDQKPLKKWFVASQIQILSKDKVTVRDFQKQTIELYSANTEVMLKEGFYQFESKEAFWIAENY
jgi:hypothetical protein